MFLHVLVIRVKAILAVKYFFIFKSFAMLTSKMLVTLVVFFIILNKELSELAKGTDSSHFGMCRSTFSKDNCGLFIRYWGRWTVRIHLSCGPRDGRVGLVEKAMWSWVYFLLGRHYLGSPLCLSWKASQQCAVSLSGSNPTQPGTSVP